MVHFIPLGDKDTASSRLRVYNIAPHLGASIGSPRKYESSDVLIIQKVPDMKELWRAKQFGAKVIYDIDDHWFDQKKIMEMIEVADIVTVDTEEKKRILGRKNVHVIPDSLDWDGVTRGYDVKNNIACWTSYGNNAGYLEGIEIPYKLKLITTADYKDYFTGECEYVKWDLGSVDKEIRDSEMMIIRLPDDEVAQSKGMHKLLKAWANGVPCYTSPMPDYLKAMNEAGVEGYIVEDWKNLKNIGFNEKCRQYAFNYSAEKVAMLWKELTF